MQKEKKKKSKAWILLNQMHTAKQMAGGSFELFASNLQLTIMLHRKLKWEVGGEVEVCKCKLHKDVKPYKRMIS